MLVRFLIAVTLALFAVPGAAPACHDSIAGPGMAMEHHAPGKATPPHACIGCVPPADWLGAGVFAPAQREVLIAHAVVTTIDLGRAPRPALPPPRNG